MRKQADRCHRIEDGRKIIQETIGVQDERSRRISNFISEVEAMPETAEFLPDCWGHLVDRVTVYSRDRITFTFTSGLENFIIDFNTITFFFVISYLLYTYDTYNISVCVLNR